MMTRSDPPRIPEHLHFIWFGPALPDFGAIAIRSALRMNPGATATLWHDDEFEPSAEVRAQCTQGLSLRRIDPDELFDRLEARAQDLDMKCLRQIYATLREPAGRANVVRILVLYLFGGIYVDTDTLTVKSFEKLRELAAFCGEEHILWPSHVSRADPRPLLLAEVRRLCSSLPYGYRLHRKMLSFYSRAANNAVLGAAPGHPFLIEMLRDATQIPRSEWRRRFRLGTHLLQDTLRRYRPTSDDPAEEMRVLSPDFFYPIGPRVSRHYFRKRPDPERVAQELLREDTHVIHWYASVADLHRLGYEHILRSEKSDVFSLLCRRYVGTPEIPRSSFEGGLEIAPAW